MKQYKENYLGLLDAVRGLMAFWVFFYHLGVYCLGEERSWIRGGAVAVDIFMFLSGFLMAYHWQIRQGRFNNFRSQTLDFYVRRFFRIAPLYYLLLTVSFLGQNHFFGFRDSLNSVVFNSGFAHIISTEAATKPSMDLANIILHYTFLFGLFPKFASNGIIPDWSISLEMQFYLIFPFLMILITRFKSSLVVVLSVVLAYWTNKMVGLYYAQGLLGNYPQPSLILFKINIFVSGICLALAYLYKKEGRSKWWLVLGFVSLIGAKSLVLSAAFLIIFFLYFDFGEKTLFNRFTSGRIARFFGDTSYSVYLIHNLILLPVLYFLFHQPWFINGSISLRFVVSFALISIPVYGVSYFLFKLIELPGIEMGRVVMLKNKKSFSPS